MPSPRLYAQLKRLPIRYILLLAFLLVGLAPTLLIANLAYSQVRAALIKEITRDIETRARGTAVEIDRMLFERLQNVVSWSRLEIMQDIRIGDVDKRLAQFLREVKDSYQDIYSELYVLDKNGRIAASSDSTRIGLKPAPLRPWLNTHLSQTTIKLGQLADNQLPVYVHIVDGMEGAELGTLVAVFNWQQIAHVLSNSISGQTAAALFAYAPAGDAQASVMAVSPTASPLAMTQQWTDIQANRNIAASAVTQGYQTFSGFSWHIVIAKNRTEAFVPIHRMTKAFVWILLATMLLIALIALPISQAITRPLARLTRFANHFMQMPSTLPPPEGGPAEINDMSRAFGKMIADLERSRENLTRAAKLAVVGEMAAAMSHEVRTPLGILRSSAQVLLRETSLSADGKEVCGFILSETERLNRLVSTLIDSARPRAPEIVATDIVELAQQTSAMLRAQAERKNIALNCQIDADDGITRMVACDREQITQVLLNLMINAIQVLPEHGNIDLQLEPAETGMLIKVADDGPGVPEEQRKQIFDPFFTQRAGGIGLGLAVVRQIVLAHHGEISVQQSAMGGAEFRLLLPYAASD